MTKTPLGVAVLAALNMLVGLLMLLGGLGVLGPLVDLVVAAWLLSLPLSTTVIGIFYILLGLGLLLLMSWAYWVDIVFVIINILLSLVALPSISWVSFVINVAIVVYLSQSSIKRKFR
ncbi:MAG: hypothetical protein C4K49_04980 [Candidatus Thorarchaeota archaeon]|nr:MAG: hypothetical protein C4K49_04980 [Candidatus Thorarchaeota archaeon]